MRSWNVVVMLVTGLGMFVLASWLSPALRADSPSGNDVLAQVLGGTTELVAERAFDAADVYFHAGYRSDTCPDRVGCSPDKQQTVVQQPINRRPLMGVVKQLHREVSPSAHRHLQGKDERELLPWFVVAARLNPHHIDAWCTGAYWFYRTGDPQQALGFIADGIRHNPNDYRVYLERGVLYHRMRNWQAAKLDLMNARRLWRNLNDEAPYDRKTIESFLQDTTRHLGSK